MNDQRKVKRPPSLLERAADMFGLDPAANAPTIDVSNLPPEPAKKARKVKAEPAAEAAVEDEPVEDVEDERDLEAEAAARAAFCATMARLPEGVRERVQTLPPQEMRRFILALAEGRFPGLDLDGEAQPQGP